MPCKFYLLAYCDITKLLLEANKYRIRSKLRICKDCCELWPVTATNSETPIERWSLCNIVSWGSNNRGIRFVVLSDQIVPQKYGSSKIVKMRFSYQFSTFHGAEIVACLKRLTGALASELQKAMETRTPQEADNTTTATKPQELTSASSLEAKPPPPQLTMQTGQNVFQRSYSNLLADEAGVPIDVMKEALHQEGRDASKKRTVLSAAERIWNSRKERQKQLAVASSDKPASTASTSTQSAGLGMLNLQRSYSNLLADEAGVPIEVMKEALNQEGRGETGRVGVKREPTVISAAQRIYNSRSQHSLPHKWESRSSAAAV